MKKCILFCTLLLALCIIPTACRTKQLRTDKVVQTTEVRAAQTLDSLFTEIGKRVSTLENQSLLQSAHFSLSTVTDKDGTVRDLIYTHEKDGKLIEKITLSGGQLTQSGQYTATHNKALRKDNHQQHTYANAIHNTSERSTAKNIHKQKEVKVKGFQAGFYITLIVVLIALVALGFIAWRLNLFQYFKKNLKGI